VALRYGPPSVQPPNIRPVVRIRLYAVAAAASGIAAYVLGATPQWAVAIGVAAPAILAAAPHFVRGTIAGLSTREGVATGTSGMSGTDFEDYVARVVRSCGVPVIMTPVTGDWGVDLIVGKRPNRLAIQC
jgi:restriction system protein